MRQVRGEDLNIGCVLTWGLAGTTRSATSRVRTPRRPPPSRCCTTTSKCRGSRRAMPAMSCCWGSRIRTTPARPGSRTGPRGRCRCCNGPGGRAPSPGMRIRAGACRSGSADTLAPKCRRLTASAPTSTSSRSRIPARCDFISAVDTPWPWELNIWYHTLNLGFRTRISGETDFPCIYDDRVGLGRTYTKLDRLTYRGWLDALRAGRSYVSDGLSHLMDFAVNGVAVGTGDGTVTVTGAVGRGDRARHGATRRGRRRGNRRHARRSEAVLGHRAGARRGHARGAGRVSRQRPRGRDQARRGRRPPARSPRDVAGWRGAVGSPRAILPSSHTNPVFVTVDQQPMRPSIASARWALEAVERCWKQKVRNIRESERAAASAAYDHARAVYRKLLESGIEE